MLLVAFGLLAACVGIEEGMREDFATNQGGGVLILCEGNFNSGNASLSYYDPERRVVENGVFRRANDRKLGDTGQSIIVNKGKAWVAVENSGILWAIDAKTFRVEGQLTAGETEHMINPRFVHLISDTKAYVTDLYSPYITVFNPQTMTYTKSIATGQPTQGGYASTEEMVGWGKYVFTNCWSYGNKVLVIDTELDTVVDSIVLSSLQPKSMVVDANDKLWVVTDGGYSTGSGTLGDNVPHLYRIDAATRQVELDLSLGEDEANVQLATNPRRTALYLMNNDLYRMDITDRHLPLRPWIEAPVDADGRRHKLYGLGVDPKSGDVYVGDAVDYAQAGVVMRYSQGGEKIDEFRVGITPNGFAFTEGDADVPQDKPEVEEGNGLMLVDTIYEYMPAPGHQVNGYTVVGDMIRPGATMREACDTVMSHFRQGHMVSLGAQGGYVVAGFREALTNGHGDYDLVVRGNPYSYQNEPGIVWVMHDDNGDCEPNDTWYELRGSEYGTDNHTTGYEITYYKPTAPAQDIRWTDNMGGEGVVPYMAMWNSHDSYWQDWVEAVPSPQGLCRTYRGSRLRDMHTYNPSTNMSQMPPYAWGYTDNLGSDTERSHTYLKIDNAVTATGEPANLEAIHFVRIQTGQTGCTPNLGEISTEVYGIYRPSPSLR